MVAEVAEVTKVAEVAEVTEVAEGKVAAHNWEAPHYENR